jgi:endonuclease/exonuclease/phosphatase family metal-dependent hydrolase
MPAKKITLTTFNCENLFNRYTFLDLPYNQKNYEKYVMAATVASIASRQGDLVTYTTTQTQRRNTALAITEADPDILVVNEIENLYTLRNFNNGFLSDRFDRMLAIDGNDPRGIDVGVLIRKGLAAEVIAVRTHIDDHEPGKTILRRSVANFGYMVQNAIFSRDCLEVDVRFNGKILTIMANHLKAQDSNPAKSRARRRQQADRVAALVTQAVQGGKLPVVLGDLNTDPVKTPADTSLDPLLQHPLLQDSFGGVAAADKWTHFYESGSPAGKSVSRLDYILPHTTLNISGVKIVRKGLSTKCKVYTGPRFPNIGSAHTEASDHCPVSVTLEV